MPRIKKQWVQATKNNTMVGSKVRVKLSIARPRFGWGAVLSKEEGEVCGIKKCFGRDLQVNFPSQHRWSAIFEDLEVFNA